MIYVLHAASASNPATTLGRSSSADPRQLACQPIPSISFRVSDTLCHKLSAERNAIDSMGKSMYLFFSKVMGF
jgi:hypothetical protein